MKKNKKTTWYILLLIGAFTLALGFRFLRLGNSPLDDREASIAIQALAVAEDTETVFGDFISIIGLTSLDFFLFSSTNFLARFWSAFIGALIVFIPFLFKEHLGKWPAMIAAFFLAISPEMVGLSRIIGTPMIAMIFFLLTLGFINKHRPILGGIFLALSLMSGASFLIGIIILGTAWLLTNRFSSTSDLISLPDISEKKSFWLPFGVAAGMTILIIGTNFFLEPAGLSGVFSGLITFIMGFGSGYLYPYYLLPLTLFAYSGSALIFGVWYGIIGKIQKQKFSTFLFFWFTVGLAVFLIYPGSRPADLPWLTLPLWLLTAQFLFRSWRFPKTSRLIVFATVSALIVLSSFVLIALRTMVMPDMGQQQQINTLIALVGGLVLIVVVLLLVRFGWGKGGAVSGLVIGLVLVNVFGMISLSVNTTSIGPGMADNLWYPHQPQLSTQWLMLSIDRISDWNESGGTAVDIEVSDFNTPGMMWTLRGSTDLSFVPYLSPLSQSGIVITDDQNYPELINSYRGQDLVWSQKVLWKEMTPLQYLHWLVTRNAVKQKGQVILWVRTDLMVDDQLSQ